MSNKAEDLVENPHASSSSARNLADAANADQSILGYAAVNGLVDDEVAKRAYELYLERQRTGKDGNAEGDWFRAEEEVRRGRP